MSHSWELKNQHMKIEDEIISNIVTPPVLSVSEAEQYVESLVEFSIEEVGTDKWMQQHEKLEKLNLQAHHCALSNTDEFVLEAFLTFSKLKLLVHDLLVTETWVDFVFPQLMERVAGRNSMRVYFMLYHQATIINLLEVLLFHKHVCEACGDISIELIDYCARKLMRLNGGYNFSQFDPISDRFMPSMVSSDEIAKENNRKFLEKLDTARPIDELTKHLSEIEFKTCISAVSVCRLLCENCDSLPLSASSRITDIHDYIILILPLIENPPWTRRVGNKWQKLIDNKWSDVPAIDLLKLTKLEAQPWLAVFSLLSKKIFRERYPINSFRKGQLLRVRKYINDILLDQLPVLADIQRYMDELALADVSNEQDHSGVFKMSQVAVYREKLLKGKDWKLIADVQFTSVFTMTDSTDGFLKRMADMYCDEAVEGILEPLSINSTGKSDVSGNAVGDVPEVGIAAENHVEEVLDLD